MTDCNSPASAISIRLRRETIKDRSLFSGPPSEWIGFLFSEVAQIVNGQEGPLKHKVIQSLQGRTLQRGDEISTTLHNTTIKLTVIETRPAGRVLITDKTAISISSRDADISDETHFNDVGGLEKEIERVREMVELPLLSPQTFAQLGIEPPKGLLLYGPPGCGKTLIARAVAHEVDAFFINVNGPEVIQKHYGESEELLRHIFSEAEKNAPAIIFFDEIDALAPNRETVLGDVEKRIVAQLLALMDGVRNRGQIVVIAATNIPNSLDPALRRPGRFDREIGINPPSPDGRLHILQIHSRRMPLADDVDLEQIAAATHGFVGADLAALCREAAMTCASRHRQPISTTDSPTNQPGLTVTASDFLQAIQNFKISSTRELSTITRRVHWDDIGGLDAIKQLLQQAIEWPLRYPARFRQAHTRPARGILLTGASGTGKTLLVQALATESAINVIDAKGPELLSKWVGETERGIREIFKRARQSAPALIFIDEIDSIAQSRGEGGDNSQLGERIVGQLLLEIDNLSDADNIVLIAATNKPELVDRALLRPGRFDHQIALPMPNVCARLAILQAHCRAKPLAEDVDLSALAEAASGFTGAELAEVCRRAALAAVGRSIALQPGTEFDPLILGRTDFEDALASINAERIQPAVGRYLPPQPPPI